MIQYLPSANFRVFTGVVENNVDPLKLGRVQARLHGYHTDNVTAIPSEDLPWAFVTQTNSKSATPIEIGEWVTGFFLDGDECQKPLIIGVIPGITANAEDEQEPTTSRVYRNELLEDLLYTEIKNDLTTLGDIEQPENPYGAVHPFNKVIETSSGHIIEIDDTEGNERIHVYHKSGTFEEIDSTGQKVEKVVADSFVINIGSRRVLVQTDELREINGNLQLHVYSNETKTVDGTIEETISGTYSTSGESRKQEYADYTLEVGRGATATIALQNGRITLANNTTDLKTILSDILSVLQNLTTPGNFIGNLGSPVVYAPAAADLQKILKHVAQIQSFLG
jgi:hypothetical protein